MKILMTMSEMERFWSHRVELARAIVDKGWTLVLAAEGADANARLAQLGICGLGGPAYKNMFSHIAIMIYLARVIRDEQPDMLHGITLRHAFYMAVVTRFMRAPIPSVFTIAGLGSLFSARSFKMRALRPVVLLLLRVCFARPGIHLIFQNEDDRAKLVAAGVIQRAHTTLIRGSGVNLTAFPFTPEQDWDRPVVLFVSRLLKEKGIYEFVAAARLLKEKRNAARFVVAGDFYPKNPGSLDPAVMQGWVDEGVIEWRGQVADMPSLLQQSALVTLPSYYGEGVPKALLEAAAIGRAVVTTDMPGCREAVQDKVTGLLVPPRDAAALADALAELLAHPDRRRAMGAAGRRYIESDFAVESVVSRTLGVYDRAVGDAP